MNEFISCSEELLFFKDRGERDIAVPRDLGLEGREAQHAPVLLHLTGQARVEPDWTSSPIFYRISQNSSHFQ